MLIADSRVPAFGCSIQAQLKFALNLLSRNGSLILSAQIVGRIAYFEFVFNYVVLGTASSWRYEPVSKMHTEHRLHKA